MNKDFKKYSAELIGTMLLVIFGCGAAVFYASSSVLTVAFAFGLVIVAMAYAIGPISGCHINPAVSIAMFVNKRIDAKEFCMYVVSQVIGAIIGAGILYSILNMNGSIGDTLQLGQNGLGNLTVIAAIIIEVLLTFVFVTTVMVVSGKKGNPATAGLVIGLTLTLVHILGIPFTGTSVNPARSIGPAIFVGGEALKQLWIFILAPLVGGVLAAVFSKNVLDSEKK